MRLIQSHLRTAVNLPRGMPALSDAMLIPFVFPFRFLPGLMGARWAIAQQIIHGKLRWSRCAPSFKASVDPVHHLYWINQHHQALRVLMLLVRSRGCACIGVAVMLVLVMLLLLSEHPKMSLLCIGSVLSLLEFHLSHAWRWITAPWRLLPDVCIIGAAKCGSTSMMDLLGALDGVRLPWFFQKETHFLTKTLFLATTLRVLRKYSKLPELRSIRTSTIGILEHSSQMYTDRSTSRLCNGVRFAILQCHRWT